MLLDIVIVLLAATGIVFLIRFVFADADAGEGEGAGFRSFYR